MGAIYVGKKIGVGGFEKEVVLKQLLPEFTSRPEFRDLFFREAKISATLDHQNIVRTFDLVTSEDRLFIVMEYVRGADLRSIAWRARRKRPLSAQAILHVALEILAGLAYAHRRRSPSGEPLGIIHRDLSPSNILCSAEGEVKLSDFGIAKAATYSSAFYRVRGKVGYMSPEMAHNQPIDARSDLFSLGVSIYETLIGERSLCGRPQYARRTDLRPARAAPGRQVPEPAARVPGRVRQGAGSRSRPAATRMQSRSPMLCARWRTSTACSTPRRNWRPSCASLLGPNPDKWLARRRRPAACRHGSPGRSRIRSRGSGGVVRHQRQRARPRAANLGRALASTHGPPGRSQRGSGGGAASPLRALAAPAPSAAGSAAFACWRQQSGSAWPRDASPGERIEDHQAAPARAFVQPASPRAAWPPSGARERNLWITLALATLALLAAGALLLRGGVLGCKHRLSRG